MKRKAPPQNPLVYWWNEFLFARSFEFVSDLSPEQCVERLKADTETLNGCLGIHRYIVIKPQQGNGWRLYVEVSNRQTLAWATGTILFDENRGKTVIQGKSKLGVIAHLYLLFHAALFLSFCGVPGAFDGIGQICCAYPPVFVLWTYAWFQMYHYRNQIIADLDARLLVKQKTSHLEATSESSTIPGTRTEASEIAPSEQEQHKNKS